MSDSGVRISSTNGTQSLKISSRPIMISKMATSVKIYPVSAMDAIKSDATLGGLRQRDKNIYLVEAKGYKYQAKKNPGNGCKFGIHIN